MIGDKKVLFSGMQATGNLTLGNYLGALKNWVSLSDEYECFYSVVDMHSITVRQDPATLRKRARALLTLYIAAGLDPAFPCHVFHLAYLRCAVLGRRPAAVFPVKIPHFPPDVKRSGPKGHNRWKKFNFFCKKYNKLVPISGHLCYNGSIPGFGFNPRGLLCTNLKPLH